MSFSITVIPGWRFDEENGERIDLVKLNKLISQLQVSLSGTIEDTDISANIIQRSKLKSQPDMWQTDNSTAADTIVLATAPNTYSALADGMVIVFVAGYTNTGAVTVNVDNTGAKYLTKGAGSDLEAGDIEAGQVVAARYDLANNRWLMINPGGRVIEVNDGATDGDEPRWNATTAKWETVKARAQKFIWTDSGALSLVSAGGVAVSHGLTDLAGDPVVPDLVTFGIICTDAGGDAGYAENDIVQVQDIQINGGPTWGVTWKTSSQIGFAMRALASEAPYVKNKATGVTTVLAGAKWTLTATAIAHI